MSPDPANALMIFTLRINHHRRLVWSVTVVALLISLIGMAVCWRSPSIAAPVRLGLDFTGGTQIQIERRCETGPCPPISVGSIQQRLERLPLSEEDGARPPSLAGAAIQVLDEGRSLMLRLPSLSAEQGQEVVDGLNELAGPFAPGGFAVETIGPSLGAQLLRSSLISLLVSFVGISLYITFRYARIYAVLALVCLFHDVLITAGIFAWLGVLAGVEVNSLFAVALLTVAGYSVNDTVVVFDRIREKSRELASESVSDQADAAVAVTLTRTLYTSVTTLLPLIALILFGGSTLFWFAVALALGIMIGSWSSIALAPTLLPLFSRP